MEKTGDVKDGSFSDFDGAKKAEYFDRSGPLIADEANKAKLQLPTPISELNKPE